ncbi:MAG: preprotein translocase subunit YajC [Candidatus Poribacteria bacterium]|nr:preprotein translocase subunit YajC [Candidatus Poribacteria bacterium]MDE0315796.1 preprotein translocase subunit YajC [Candidatus Poribacteria bacterium]MDE0480979.1 preprotein translocase subunit YajC [Candidatus Poribacteria bacterium]
MAESPLISMLFMFIPMAAIIYFLMIRPEQTRRKKHQAMLENLTKGDEIVTNGGLHGKILGVDNDKKILLISVGEVNNQEMKVHISLSSVAFLKKGGELIEGE